MNTGRRGFFTRLAGSAAGAAVVVDGVVKNEVVLGGLGWAPVKREGAAVKFDCIATTSSTMCMPRRRGPNATR